MKIILFLVIVAVLVSGCMIGDGERDYAMSHITPTDAQSFLITPAAIPIPSTPTPPSLYWIKIDPISDKQEGEIFTINATTNLSVGNDIFVQIFDDKYTHNHPKMQGPYYGGWETVKVIEGRNGINTISFIANASEFNFIPEKYIVSEAAVTEDAEEQTQFNITPRKSP